MRSQEGVGAGGTGRGRPLLALAAWAGLVVALDRLSKMLVVRGLSPGQSVPVWPGVFHLTHVRNPGAAFGLLPGRDGLLLLLPAAITLVAIWVIPTLARQHPVAPLAGGFVAGGALGNLVDRVRGGLVTDFLDFRVWPVFNLADLFIVVGAGLLVLSLARGGRDTRGAVGERGQ
jgi:signal peptidase II